MFLCPVETLRTKVNVAGQHDNVGIRAERLKILELEMNVARNLNLH